MVTELPSYVRDTHDVLARLDGVEVMEGAIHVSIDVESLYTSIPHHQGLAVVAHFLKIKYPPMASQNELILELLEFSLTHNCFQFLGANYQQTRGTSMGAPWAPAYACLHLGWWEQSVV